MSSNRFRVPSPTYWVLKMKKIQVSMLQILKEIGFMYDRFEAKNTVREYEPEGP